MTDNELVNLVKEVRLDIFFSLTLSLDLIMAICIALVLILMRDLFKKNRLVLASKILNLASTIFIIIMAINLIRLSGINDPDLSGNIFIIAFLIVVFVVYGMVSYIKKDYTLAALMLVTSMAVIYVHPSGFTNNLYNLGELNEEVLERGMEQDEELVRNSEVMLSLLEEHKVMGVLKLKGYEDNVSN